MASAEPILILDDVPIHEAIVISDDNADEPSGCDL